MYDLTRLPSNRETTDMLNYISIRVRLLIFYTPFQPLSKFLTIIDGIYLVVGL